MSSCKTFFVIIAAVFMLATLTSAITLTRVQRDTNDIKLPSCSAKTPCGWAVYTPFSRRLDYFVKNGLCECRAGTKCIRAVDDLSVSAYVYQCLSIENSTTRSPAS